MAPGGGYCKAQEATLSQQCDRLPHSRIILSPTWWQGAGRVLTVSHGTTSSVKEGN